MYFDKNLQQFDSINVNKSPMRIWPRDLRFTSPDLCWYLKSISLDLGKHQNKIQMWNIFLKLSLQKTVIPHCRLTTRRSRDNKHVTFTVNLDIEGPL